MAASGRLWVLKTADAQRARLSHKASGTLQAVQRYYPFCWPMPFASDPPSEFDDRDGYGQVVITIPGKLHYDSRILGSSSDGRRRLIELDVDMSDEDVQALCAFEACLRRQIESITQRSSVVGNLGFATSKNLAFFLDPECSDRWSPIVCRLGDSNRARVKLQLTGAAANSVPQYALQAFVTVTLYIGGALETSLPEAYFNNVRLDQIEHLTEIESGWKWTPMAVDAALAILTRRDLREINILFPTELWKIIFQYACRIPTKSVRDWLITWPSPPLISPHPFARQTDE
jgi:hypothetical protein